jgi:broad specificity phosphatase PhoE
MITTLYLVRHAESEANTRSDLIGGRSNWAMLTPNGVEQSEKLGKRFEREGINYDRTIVSPAIRTQQTHFHSLGKRKEELFVPLYETRIQELDQGDWTWKKRDIIYSRNVVRKGLQRDNYSFVPGDLIKGESQAMVAQRMLEWFKELGNAEETILAISHGMAIKLLFASLFENYNKREVYKLPLENTGLCKIIIEDGRVREEFFNSYTHLT